MRLAGLRCRTWSQLRPLGNQIVIPSAQLVTWLYVYLLLLLGLWVVIGVAFAGWSPVVVTSGSMRPTLRPGDVLLVEDRPDGLLSQRAIVTFERSDGDLVVHRLFAVEEHGYVTKGDANPNPDIDRLPTSDVKGVGQLVVPLLGLPIVWAKQGATGPFLAWAGATLAGLVLVSSATLERLRRRGQHRSADQGLPIAQVGLWRVRVLVGVLMVIQFAIDPSRFDVVGSGSGRVPVLVISLVVLGAVNLTSQWSDRRGRESTRTTAIAELMIDTALVVFLATATGSSGIGWVLFALPVIEAAMRFGLAGALVHWMMLTVVTMGARIWMSKMTPGPDLLITELERVLDQLSVLFLVVVPGAYLAEQLMGDVLTQRTATDEAVSRGRMLEHVVATSHDVNRLGDLDVSAIVEATLKLGWDVADIVNRTDGDWQVVAGDELGLLPAPGASGSGLRPADLASARVIVTADDPEPSERAAMIERGLGALVALTVSDDVRGQLVLRAGALDAVPDHHRLEALRLLAGQAAVALQNEQLLGELTAISDELEHQAMHDSLTNLANRPRLLAALHAELENPEAEPVLLFLDLDGFKPVNDRLGHDAGDELLKLVAQRLQGVVRSDDLVARLGGDEFTILLRGSIPPERAREFAVRIHRRLREPFVLGQETVSISASIGIAEGEAGINQSELLRRADVAMYHAKKVLQGRAEYVSYSPELDLELNRRAKLAADLGTAIEEDALDLHYQPIMRMSDSRMIGVEALLRWFHPTNGDVGPSEVIQLADDVGLGDRLNLWILQRATSDGVRWGRLDPSSALYVTVNASPTELHSEALLPNMERALSESGLSADRLFVEISERLVEPDQDTVMRNMQALSALGVGLLLDDFGEGQTSLAYLHQLPIVGVKLDRKLVVNSSESNTERIVLESIIDLSRRLDLTVIAEGVETDAQLSTVTGVGCDLIQGFLLHPPLSAAGIDELVANQRHRAATN